MLVLGSTCLEWASIVIGWGRWVIEIRCISVGTINPSSPRFFGVFLWHLPQLRMALFQCSLSNFAVNKLCVLHVLDDVLASRSVKHSKILLLLSDRCFRTYDFFHCLDQIFTFTPSYQLALTHRNYLRLVQSIGFEHILLILWDFLCARPQDKFLACCLAGPQVNCFGCLIKAPSYLTPGDLFGRWWGFLTL